MALVTMHGTIMVFYVLTEILNEKNVKKTTQVNDPMYCFFQIIIFKNLIHGLGGLDIFYTVKTGRKH